MFLGGLSRFLHPTFPSINASKLLFRLPEMNFVFDPGNIVEDINQINGEGELPYPLRSLSIRQAFLAVRWKTMASTRVAQNPT